MTVKDIDKILMNNVFRFAIGPWKKHYSEVWRVWTNNNDKEDIYLGASSLLQCLKISLHQSGICQLSYTAQNYEALKKVGKAPKNSRHIIRWDRGKLKANEIKQILDIHFPLKMFSKNAAPKGKPKKKLFLIEPVLDQLSENDSVSLKLLFHNTKPETTTFTKALSNRDIIPAIYFELSEGFITLAFSYSKVLPIDISKEHEQSLKNGFVGAAQNLNLKVGETKENLSCLFLSGGSPPSIICISGLNIGKKTKTHLDVDFSSLE